MNVDVPEVTSLFEVIQGLEESTGPFRRSRVLEVLKTFELPHIKAFHINFTVETSVGDVDGEETVMSMYCNCNDNLLTSHACNEGKGVIEVSAFALGEVIGH